MNLNNTPNQLSHQSIVPIPLITTDNNNTGVNNSNKNPTIIQIATPLNTSNNIENANTVTTPTGHVKLSNSIKINQLPLNISASSIVLTQPSSNSPSSNTNQSPAQSNSNSNSYGGFAYCSNCREYGVKAAFYGKSKLYCSVACQNGIKKQQQQQQNQGVKRTIEALNYSPNNQSNSSNIVQQHNPINIVPSNQIPTLIPISSQVIQSNLAAGTPTILIQESNSPKIAELLAANNSQNGNKITLKSIDNSNFTTQKSTSDNKNSYQRANSVPNSNNTNNSSKSFLSSSISNTIDSVISSLDTGNINPPPSKRQRNNSVQSNSANSTSSNDNTKLNSTPNSQLSKQRSISANNNKSPSLSPTSEIFKTTTTTFYWPSYIEKEKAEAAPVSLFKHCPLNDFWHKILNNIYVEVPNKDPPDPDSIEELGNFNKDDKQIFYWFASVVQYAGYYAKLRYVGFEKDDSNDFWLHMCDKNIHPIGWAAENHIPLVPPNSLSKKDHDWKTYLIDRLTGFKTLPKTFHDMVQRSMKSKFKRGMILELVDKKKVSCMRVAKIIENIGGRIRMKYENSDSGFDDFWCHEQSEIIHPVGWSMAVGHDIHADEEYKKSSAQKYLENQYEPNECGKDMFKIPREIKRLNNQFKVNMKLEALDPLNLSSIGVATIGKVLKENYIMIKIDGIGSRDGNDMFCYHRASSSIFPAGFCEKNSLELIPPLDYKKNKFDWPSYLEGTNSQFAPIELFYDDSSFKNPFKVGMRLESVDLMEPKLICAATVVAVVNRLLKLSFDGWSKEFDQWIDCESCDLFPIGWCELVNYPLQSPNDKTENNKNVDNSNVNDDESSKKKVKRTYNKKKMIC